MEESKIVNALESLKKHPDLYLGLDFDNTQYFDLQNKLLSKIVMDVFLLEVKPITLDLINDMFVVFSEEDWLKKSLGADLTTEELFSRIVSIPEVGVNNMRSEIMLTAYARNVLVSKKGDVTIIKGKFEDTFIADCIAKYSSGYFVAFN